MRRLYYGTAIVVLYGASALNSVLLRISIRRALKRPVPEETDR